MTKIDITEILEKLLEKAGVKIRRPVPVRVPARNEREEEARRWKRRTI